MAWPASLKQRRRQPEIMDQPGLDRARHFQGLRALGRINRLSGSAGILWPAVRDLAGSAGGRPVRLLDVATGGGDVPIALWRRARRRGLNLQVEGCDVSPQALEYARERAGEQRADVRFFPLDVLRDDFPSGYDVITSSLFLHHLEEGQARDLLNRMAGKAGRLVLINDLRRGLPGLLLAAVGTRLLSTSPMIHEDGLLSVQGAFTVDEVRRLAAEAGLAGATVQRRWPCRLLLTWRRPSAPTG